MYDPPSPQPFLTWPWQAGVTGWIVVFGGLLAELVGGIITNQMPMVIAAPVLAFPVALAAVVSLVQWWQVSAFGTERASWWHLAGIGCAVFIWLVYPTTPGLLAADSDAREACGSLYTQTPDCLSRVTQAMHYHDLVWWLTGVLIVAAALLVRRSRIAAWAAIPTAFAGCLLATHFLELLLVYYHVGGESV